MSGLFDNKTDKTNRRVERTRKEEREKRRVRIITLIVVAALVIITGAALFINSRFVRRSMAAITIGGVNFSAAEFDFFYYNTYNEYAQSLSQLGDFASEYLPSNDRLHSNQILDPETGETWADYFVEYTITSLSRQVQFYNAAMAAGYRLPAESLEAIDSEVEYYAYIALMGGYPSLDSYLQNIFGNNMNEASLRTALVFAYTASAYNELMFNAFTFTEQQLAEHYLENRDDYDNFAYRTFLVKSETVSEDDYETEEEYSEALGEAQAQAYAKATEIIDSISIEGISSEEDFIEAARQYSDDYSNPGSTLMVIPGSELNSTDIGWLLDEGRRYGDMAAILSDNDSGCFVLFFISRDPNEYPLVGMRQILVLRGAVDVVMYVDGINDPEYLEALENAEEDARIRAEYILDVFVEGGHTEDWLIDMMEEHSDDTTEGGYYYPISKSHALNKLVPEIEDWLFEPDRQYGDYKLIRSAAHGYHLVFFMEHGERYCDFIAEGTLRNDAYTAWRDGLEEVDFQKHWAFMFTQH